MKVKICGITDIESGMAAVRYGADAIGFVFAESKRKISEASAKEIITHLPEGVMKVGVFVNEAKTEIERIAAAVGLTHIQLHGDESAPYSESIPLPVIKAISFQNNAHLANYNSFPSEYLLLDGPKGRYQGGNGLTFDWSQVTPNLIKDKKVILAGGLTTENLEEAIRSIRPDMVDVSSGVETDGSKDIAKIKTFIEKAKNVN